MPEYIGTTIGGCRILSKIAQGGMGAVYEAEQASLQRRVAVKILLPHLATDETYVTRFLREARSVAKLRHPNILEVYDAGRAGETVYMVTELVRGANLAQRVREKGAFGEGEALAIVHDIASALVEAANHGLVHRDLKPGNVMIADTGLVKVMDFGLAKDLAAEAQTVTEVGALVGTPQYMSPEQIQGEAVDVRSDLYSLGLLLFFLVTGKPAYAADSLATVLHDQVYTPVPDPRTWNPAVSEPLRCLMLKMTRKRPAERFQSPREVLDAIRDIRNLADRPDADCPGLAWAPSPAPGGPGRRLPYAAAAVLGVTLLAAALVGLRRGASRTRIRPGAAGTDLVLRWNTNGIITFMNDDGLAFFGYDRADVLGKPVVGTIVPRADSRGRDLHAMIRDIQTRPDDFQDNTNQNIRSDGRLVWVRWSNQAIFDGNNRLVEILSTGSPLAGPPPLSPPAPRKAYEEYLAEGKTLMDQKNWAGALAVFQAAKEAHPEKPEISLWIDVAEEKRRDVAQRDLAPELLSPGRLTVLVALYPPFYGEDAQGCSSGYDLDLLRRFAARHGLTLQLVRLSDWKSLIAQLAAGKADVAAAGITITEERKAAIDFSAPYFSNCQVIVAKTGSGIDDLGDLAGKRVGYVPGTTHERTVTGLAKATPVTGTDEDALAAALAQGDIDAFVDDIADAVRLRRKHASIGIACSLDRLESFGFALRKGTPFLKTALDAFLKETEATGLLKELYATHFDGT